MPGPLDIASIDRFDMAKAASTLFIGNGPNLITMDQISWKDVLRSLSSYARDRQVLKHYETKPFTLFYEELVLRCVRRGRLESDLKKHVANLMKEMKPNGVHSHIMGAGFSHIITTNYDNCLEASSVESAVSANLHPEKRYNVFRRWQAGNTNIWHIHGEIEKPRTITLGHDHYVGYLGKMKDYLVWDRSIKNPRSWKRSSFAGGDIAFEKDGSVYSWVDVFLRDDIHIVGFSLDYSEIDLWWLLLHKERFRLKSKKYSKMPKVGNTFFYHVDEANSTTELKAKLSLLASVGVEIIEIDSTKGYEYAYHKVIDRIRKNA